MGLGSASHSRGFHVNRVRPVRLCQLGFLLHACGVVDADDHPMPYAGLDPASIPGINDADGRQHCANFESGIQGSGKTRRLHHHWCIEANDRFGRAARCFGPNTAANQHSTLVLEESVTSPFIFALDRSPMSNERTHLALQRSYDGDFWCASQYSFPADRDIDHSQFVSTNYLHTEAYPFA